MRIYLSNENLKKVRAIITDASVKNGYFDINSGKRKETFRGKPDYLKFNTEKSSWEVRVGNEIMSLRSFLLKINTNDKYRSSSKKLKELAATFAECNAQNAESKFQAYLNQLENKEFEIEDVSIETDVVEWIKQHVTTISARFPSKYEFAFKRAFPAGHYTVDDRTWNYSFSMGFDTLKGMPQALATLKNKNGNTIDVNAKRLCYTSYIWKFVLDNPDYPFGYHRA